MFQERRIDPTGTNPAGIWVNPLAALPHCYPILLRKAILIATARIEGSYGEGPDREAALSTLGEHARSLAKFIKIAATEPAVDTAREAMANAGLNAQRDIAVRAIIDGAISDVMAQSYFQLLREALHPGEKPVGVKELLEVVPEERTNANNTPAV